MKVRLALLMLALCTPAQARDNVTVAQAGLEAACDFLEQRIAGFVTKGIVDLFESIKIYKCDRQLLVGAMRLTDGLT